MESVGVNVIEAAALGRPFQLGMLYDCRNDALVPGITLWNREELLQNIQCSPQIYTNFKITASDSIEEKFSLLNIDASMKLSLFGGLISVTGAAKYLNDTKKSFIQQRLTLHYHSTTKFEELTMNHLASENIAHHKVFDDDTATHVVTAVLYGVDACFVFDREVSSDENKTTVEREVRAVFEKLKCIEVDGDANLNMTEVQRRAVQKFSVTFYGDFQLPSNLTSFEDALKVFADLPKLLGENRILAVPLKVWLYPLDKLDSRSSKLLKEISLDVIRDIESALESLNTTEMKCIDLLKDPPALAFTAFHNKILQFKENCKNYKLSLVKKLGSLLPQIRGIKIEDSALIDLLKDHNESPFRGRELAEWLKEREDESEIIKLLLRQLNDCGAKVEENLQAILMDLDVENLVSYTFTSIECSDPLFTKQKTYLSSPTRGNPNDNTSDFKKEKSWLTPDIQKTMKNNLEIFKNLIGLKDRKPAKFIVSSQQMKNRPGSCILLYEDGCVEAVCFTPPSQPGPPVIAEVKGDSVVINVQPSTCPATEELRLLYKMKHNKVWTSQLVQRYRNTATLIELRPGTEYEIKTEVVGKLNYTTESDVITFITERNVLKKLLESLGLAGYYNEKLTLSTVLQIGKDSVSDVPAKSLTDLPWLFLKRLMILKRTVRSVGCSSSDGVKAEDSDWDDDQESDESDSHLSVNPLDILTGLFLCSDSFLQQEMILKMSMCQFSVPLLLPNSDTNQITLMLWAMRNIVKKYRPHSLQDSSGFVQERIALSELPLVSFVRLERCSLSKSEILNKLLSNPQQYTDTFVHFNMDCGNIKRKISNGLVEISWYLPCGNENMDVFTEPVAIANLRGDIKDFETQFSFLCQVSTAVFVFFDNKHLNTDNISVASQKSALELFYVGESNNETIKATVKKLNLKKSNFIFKGKQNDTDFVNQIRTKLHEAVEKNKHKVSVVRLAEVARKSGILVDEDAEEFQSAKASAAKITSKIKDIVQFKKNELPLQGDMLLELAKLEKEECRLKKAGDQSIENYKSDLQMKINKLREKQYRTYMSDTMSCFIKAISSPNRAYFIKWLRILLENLSHEVLPSLREQYKQKCQDAVGNKKEIAELDKRISNSSLGVEHFIREMSQLYEAAVSLSEDSLNQKQLEHLPRLCAELLLDGFPLELVDGDASNVPVKWLTSVMTELNTLVKPKNKIGVVTVLGVQSSGKSTLLNTMFGVQFAVSSGRCTRGAFMQLIKVTDNFKAELNSCDYILIIDTEGLKSAELAQLDNSYEHDNELATLVVGLSDITIVNIAMENSTEMKDILQIVVHAFLRMKEIGKKHRCLFVHQNVADVSAHDSNIRDRKFLMDQLNEMTQAAAKMEYKLNFKKFTDVMEYNTETDDHYIPGLWHGNPPMAPVNTGYSESVFALKKQIMKIFESHKPGNIGEFLNWSKDLWTAVKYEKFIFSFRNSLVADAYMKLCTEYNRWEWSLRKQMHTWGLEAETKILNHGKFDISELTVEDLKCNLQQESDVKLSEGEKEIIDKITSYYDQGEGHVELVESFRQDFINSAKSLKKELLNSITIKLDAALSRRNGMMKVEGIIKTYMDKIEKRVLDLLKDCREKKANMSEFELDKAFENMWQQTLRTLPLWNKQPQDIIKRVLHNLRINLQAKGGSVAQNLATVINLNTYGCEKFVVTKGNILTKHWHSKWIKRAQETADSIVEDCWHFIEEKQKRKDDYDDTYMRELLNMIDDKLKDHEDLKLNEEFELSLKLHICGFASRAFQKIHKQFIHENCPHKALEKHKETYRTDFIDLFHERDQCQKKADEFTKNCLKPAIEEYMSEVLGTKMADEMLLGENSQVFGSRTTFQNSLLKKLLDELEFEKYLRFIESYEKFVKNFILDKIIKHFSAENRMFKLEENLLDLVTSEITQAIEDTEQYLEKHQDMKGFIQNICKELEHRLVFPKDEVDRISSLTNVKTKQFAECLKCSVKDMNVSMKKNIQGDIKRKVKSLQTKPQDVLFKRVQGCGKQCPFCKAPCEAGAEAHTKHFVSIHRPDGLGLYTFCLSEELSTDICTSLVLSDKSFMCEDTNNQYHPYKKYSEIYPDWQIDHDPSIDASAYWKFVMTHFNEEFAEVYDAQPADIPSTWKDITKSQAEESLK